MSCSRGARKTDSSGSSGGIENKQKGSNGTSGGGPLLPAEDRKAKHRHSLRVPVCAQGLYWWWFLHDVHDGVRDGLGTMFRIACGI